MIMKTTCSKITYSFWALILTFLASHCFAAIPATLHLRSGELNVVFEPRGNVFKQAATGQGPGGGGLQIYDGKAKKDLQLNVQNVEETKTGWELTCQSEDKTLVVTQSVKNNDGYISWDVNLKNLSQQEKWLEVTLSLPTGLRKNQSNFWDGFEERPVSDGYRQRQGISFTFPVSCTYDKINKRGAALGLNPFQDFTYIKNSICELGGKEKTGLTYSARIVLEPVENANVDFVMFAFTANYTWWDAVQKYYDFFPKAFNPAPDINPDIISNGRYFYNSNPRRNIQIEHGRRYRESWDWAYGSFQTPGDWYPDEKFWDKSKGYPGAADNHQNEVEGTIEDYRRETRYRYWEGRKSGAILFYVLPQMCEVNLMEKYFPDSYFLDNSGNRRPIIKNYIKVDSNTIRAWHSGGTSYEKEVKKDFKKIVEDFKPSGFAFDVAFGSMIYGGPAQKGMPGRSWTDKGTIVASGISLKELFDWIHEQKVEGYRLGIAINAGNTFTIYRNTDVIMYEPSPYRLISWSYRFLPVRLMSGNKIISHHMGYNEMAKMVRWKELEPEQIVEAVRGVIDYDLLWSLRWGAFPSLDMYGSKKTHEWAPILLTLLRKGWQAVPAMRADDRLWVSRYGKGMNSFLAVSNPKREAIKSKITIDTSYLGDNSYLFSTYRGKDIECKVSDNKAAIIDAEIEPHEALVLRPIIEIDGGHLTLTGNVSYDVNPLQKGMLTANFTVKEKPARKTIRCNLPEGSKVKRIEHNNQMIDKWSKESDQLIFSVNLAEENSIKIEYEPLVVVKKAPADFMNFPFIVDNRPNCVIVSDEKNDLSAQRISAYFEYWHLRQKHPGGAMMLIPETEKGPRIPICRPENVPADARRIILIGDAEDNPLINEVSKNFGILDMQNEKNREILLVAGTNVDCIKKATMRLLEILDEKYPYYGGMANIPMLQKAGLVGKVLD